ncbi:NAD(P)H oxidoreductase YrkL @ Putative NADPH-quinone reductase (modulator of drug activity B) @ Flavodoxin 2 [hydrothermal vent metagenome]|uniref:NAD(P)H oxidoreductase YrkL @ Putative NADPH-quinone reductase (Modulator of drug activity B) @ Flavodoxin 2 n=1 Tax=hydrothermal vent metagenome TaxID=652676 RepID=A0A3B0U3P9_9ZZZZ
MKCLIVNAHPLPKSLCVHLRKQVQKQLLQAGHQVEVEDLYEVGFKPSLSEKERHSYYEQQYKMAGVADQALKLVNTQVLILIFPTWWFGFPAILKGWFDRVWSPGIAFDHAKDFAPIKGRLNKLKHVLVITSLGSPWWVDWLIMRRPVKRIIKHGLVGACAPHAKVNFLSIYQAENLPPEKIKSFLMRIERAIMSWQ